MHRLLSLFLTGTLLFGCEADGRIWMPPSNRADALFRIIIHDRAGFIDGAGRIVIAPSLEVSANWGQAFYDGLLSLGAGDGPFLNSKGEKVLDNGFFRIWDFSERLAAALKTFGSKWGYVDHSGQFVIPPQFPFYPQGLVSSFSDGLAAVEVLGKLGYIDHSGAFVIPRQFVAGTSFENGIARVVAEGPCDYRNYEHHDPCMSRESNVVPSTGVDYNRARSAGRPCKWRFIDKTGKRIINAEFDATFGFHEGLAAVQVGAFGASSICKEPLLSLRPSRRCIHSPTAWRWWKTAEPADSSTKPAS
ncbi:MAG: WG repeat-containing protein [Acidobacteriota bacterium]|nr:WG repeat-containing protein [Acidobacteriota bacterium]